MHEINLFSFFTTKNLDTKLLGDLIYFVGETFKELAKYCEKDLKNQYTNGSFILKNSAVLSFPHDLDYFH